MSHFQWIIQLYESRNGMGFSSFLETFSSFLKDFLEPPGKTRPKQGPFSMGVLTVTGKLFPKVKRRNLQKLVKYLPCHKADKDRDGGITGVPLSPLVKKTGDIFFHFFVFSRNSV